MEKKTATKKMIFSLALGLFILVFGRAQAGLNPEVFSPPAGNKVSEQELVISGQPAKLIHYESDLSERDIRNFYANSLTNQGWVASKDNPPNGPLSFSKENQCLNILFLRMPQQRKSQVTLTLFENCPACAEKKLSQEETAEDKPGEDPALVPRYPASIRTFSLKTGIPQGATAIYKTQDSKEEVLDFYAQRLAEGGWQEDRRISLADLKEDPRMAPIFQQPQSRMPMDAISIFYSKDKNSTLVLTVMQDPKEQGTIITVKTNE